MGRPEADMVNSALVTGYKGRPVSCANQNGAGIDVTLASCCRWLEPIKRVIHSRDSEIEQRRCQLFPLGPRERASVCHLPASCRLLINPWTPSACQLTLRALVSFDYKTTVMVLLPDSNVVLLNVVGNAFLFGEPNYWFMFHSQENTKPVHLV